MNNNHRNVKKKFAVVMSSTLICTVMMTSICNGAEVSSSKEEVIYINLDGNGNETGTYAVNIFTDKNIVDYGEYSEVKNMNTDDKINYKSGTIKVKSSSYKLYYEGVMQNVQIPWNIDINYKLDGKEYNAEDLAGKSGKLTMEIKITKNTKAKEGFFDNYALQASVKLDTNICKNIEATGATVANVGSDKQLTYTVMPGNEKDIVINADVKNFEMTEGISINGIKLNLGINKDSIDISELTDKIEELQNSVTELDSGSNSINNGAEKLSTGAVQLNDGIDTINKALETLNSKSSSLTSGSKEVQEALKTIQTSLNDVNTNANQLSELSTSSTKIKEGIDNLVAGLQTVDGAIDTYYSSLSQNGINDLNDYVAKHNEAIEALGITDTMRALNSAYEEGGQIQVSSKLKELASFGDVEAVNLYQKYAAGDTTAITNYIVSTKKLISIESLLKGDIAYIKGSNYLISGIDSSLDNANGSLMEGAVLLQTNYSKFDTNIQSMVSSLSNLASNMTKLKDGIDKLASNYDVLDGGINEYTNAVNSIKEGYSKICDGALSNVEGTSQLYIGTKSLVQGTSQFKNNTSNLDNEVDEKIDNMINNFTGNDEEIKSFVSDKNTNVSSVQFVIKTEGITIPEKNEEETAKSKELNIFQKFLKLFGFYK